jgi:hypothetical protein
MEVAGNYIQKPEGWEESQMVNTKQLAELSELAQQLNVKSNNLNDSIKSLNAQLSAMKIGLEFYMTYPALLATGKRVNNNTSPATKYEQNTYLGWDRPDDKWELTVKAVTTEYQWNSDEREEETLDEEEYTSLLESSREIRLKAIEQFDQFLDQLKAHVQEKLRHLKHAERLVQPE